MVEVEGRTEPAEQISAIVLQGMKKIVEKHIGRGEIPNLKAVVTVPAYFSAPQKKATKDAAEIAGLDCIRMISEPNAAAMAAGFHEIDDDRMVLVFDLGGGTFDVSILNITKGVISVESTGGDLACGGRDIDEALADYCLDVFLQLHGHDLKEDKRKRVALSLACE